MEASDLKRMKELEGELSQLKRMYADLALENRAMPYFPAVVSMRRYREPSVRSASTTSSRT